MPAIKALIIDDEKHARESLAALLELYCPSVKAAGSASNIGEGKKLIEKLNPDIVFLDIEIGEDTGFDLLEKISQINFQLIFVTGYSEFALKAFQVNAVDYLMKPIEPSSLVKAVDKAKKLMGTGIYENNIVDLLNSINNKKTDCISISSKSEGITILKIENIVYVQGSGTYSTFHTNDGKRIMASNNLGHYQPLLPASFFYRTHQSYLVNINCISRIIPSDGVVELSNGQQVPLARNRREGLLERLAL